MSSEWQRLSPLAIMHFAVRGLLQAVNTYALIVAGAVAISQAGLSPAEVVMAVIFALLLLFLGAVLHYLNFYYVQEPTRFLIRSGVLSKNRTELPFSKIQNVTVKEPFYYRPFGVVVLHIDSAGSSSKEVALAALSQQQAEAVQRHIQQYHAQQDVTPVNELRQAPAVGQDEQAPLLTRSTSDVILHGLAHNRAWFIFAIAAPVLAQMDQPIAQWLESLGVDFADVIEQTPAMILAGLMLLALVTVALLLSLFSVAGAVLALFDLKLFYSRGIYKRTSGLLNRYEIQVKQSRVQTLHYQQSWLDLIAKRLTMVLEPFSAAAVADNQNMMQKILLPSLNYTQLCQISRHIYPDFDFGSVHYTSAHPLYLVRALFTSVLPAVGLAAMLFWGAGVWQWFAPPAVGAVVACAMYLRWRRLGVGRVGNYLVVRSGFIGWEYFCFAAHKIQQVRFKQSAPLKRRRLASLEVVLASRSLQIPLIPEQLALELAGCCLSASTAADKSWM